ncbi:MAG: hypothetical protein HKP14_10480 [Bacteroidia bacterium]|nr:hypothetical protein [Bacteroidia bacterium]
MPLILVPYLVGFFLPIVSYNVYAITKFVKTKLSSNPDLASFPKYKILVWKIHRLMMSVNPYYVGLSKVGRMKFISRLIYLIVQKRFEGREGEVVTLEKKIIILGALVQLTFGLDKFTVKKFGFIALYPTIFYSRIVKGKVKGLTVSNGILLLSWTDAFQGFHNSNDNLNLALHEWSHALIIDHKNDDIHWLYSTLNKHLKKMDKFYKEMKKFKEERSYLRDYALTNTHEFFAVCVEHFFETPEDFYQNHKDIFYVLCRILNQNPLSREKDYKL